MSSVQLVGGEVFSGHAIGSNALDGDMTVWILEDKIASVGVAPADDRLVSNGLEIDASGLTVAPGFVDVQVNGGFGVDLASNAEGMWELGRKLTRHGVTSFLPTIISSPSSVTDAAIATLQDRPTGFAGAEPLGLHLEGPMLSPDRPGAHQVQNLAPPSLDLVAGWSQRNGVVLVTIAPELPGALDVISTLVERGVIVSAGHTESDASDARHAIAAGVTMVTHLFNAMAPLGHRKPSLVGVALADTSLVTGVIVDGVHVAPEIVAAIWNAKGSDGFVLVTDAVASMGMGPGIYELAGKTSIATEYDVRTNEGVLAGSVLSMDQAVRNLVQYTGCEPALALRSASTTPARVIGANDRGRIEPGTRADVILLDQQLSVQMTLCRGRLAFVADGAQARVPNQLLDQMHQSTQ